MSQCGHSLCHRQAVRIVSYEVPNHREFHGQTHDCCAFHSRPQKEETVNQRYLLKNMRGSSRWGIWDTELDTWHEGAYGNATYHAGVPSWKREGEARSIMHRLNGTGGSSDGPPPPTAT